MKSGVRVQDYRIAVVIVSASAERITSQKPSFLYTFPVI